MPDLTKEAALDHARDMKKQNTNHLVRHDPEIKGEVDIEVRSNGRFNVTVYKGTEEKPRVIEDISRNKLMSMLDSQL
ncbi:MAG: hypothetical protein J07AB43_01570 [Candidatus Nanosalina sp. J07AB43]|jgi:hypothetical protein|nr:MAG: hypothetical protein J07AB43_01570 [Candidatus Nanosalina sp. J07AB43]